MILVETRREQDMVAQVCRRGHALGIRIGMTRSHAQALAVDTTLGVCPASPVRDQLALHDLAQRCAARFTPLVAIDGDDGLQLDITGCAGLFGGETRLRHAVLSFLWSDGFEARAGMASTFAAARALARYDSPSGHTIASGEEHSALGPLPIAALGLDTDVVEGLEEIGLTRVEHLDDVPRGSMSSRFGTAVFRKLDEALGRTPASIASVDQCTPAQIDQRFAGGLLQIAALTGAVYHGITGLCALLHTREEGVCCLGITMERLDLPPASIEVEVRTATRDVDHLWSLVSSKVESVHLGHGVEAVAVCAVRAATLPHEQHTAWRHGAGGGRGGNGGGNTGGDTGGNTGGDAGGDRDAARATGALIDTLVARLGGSRVQRLTTADSHLPEYTLRTYAATESAPASSSAASGRLPAARPSWLRAERITMLSTTSSGHPARWAHASMICCARRTVGPETITPEWWRVESEDGSDGLSRTRGTRDYFAVEDGSGIWHWLCRVREDRAWWCHGIWA